MPANFVTLKYANTEKPCEKHVFLAITEYKVVKHYYYSTQYNPRQKMCCFDNTQSVNMRSFNVPGISWNIWNASSVSLGILQEGS